MAAIISENIAQHGIWKALQEMAGVMGRNANRVESMTDDEISTGPVIDAVGIPTYVDDVTQYPDFNLQETGWYIFARIFAKDTVLVTDETTVEGAAYTASAGDDHVCVAVRFDGAAVSQKVTVKWGAYTESFIFKATDLAARNQECRVASKAAEATQGAETATAKAQEASTSATEAGQSATSASESATAAATSASDAAGSATAASQSAEQLSSAVTQVEANTADISNLKQNIKTFVGSPLVASAAAEMTDTTRVYVYVGSETGYTFGNWYYYDGTSWVSGGVYNATAVNTDKTLTQENQPADAKKTGDEITDLKQDLDESVSDLKSAIGDINDELYVSFESVYDWTSDSATGYPYNFRPGYIFTSSGAIGTNSAILQQHVRNNKAVSFGVAKTVTITPPDGYYLRSVTEYSSPTISAENFVRNLRYSTTVNESFTFENVQGKYYAIVVGEFTDSNNYFNQPLMQSIIAEQVFEISRLDDVQQDISELSTVVKGIAVSKTNQSANYSTIKAAVEYAQLHPNTTIFVDSGEYDIIEELGGSTYTESLSGLSSYVGGLRLGNGTRLIGVGSGVKLIANYTAGTNQVMTDRFSIFNIDGSFHLENIEMEVTNVRYCVHEDMSALSANNRLPFYVGEYKNCKMRHNGTISQTYNIAACIGGGTMNKSLHIIDGCYLESPTGKNPAGYHNNATSNSGIARVILRNSYLANNGTVALTVYNSNTQVIDAEICGNRLGKAIIDNSSGLYNVKAWNNEIIS